MLARESIVKKITYIFLLLPFTINASNITSDAFNFKAPGSGSVSDMTGSYNYQYKLSNTFINYGMGPDFQLKLVYNQNNKGHSAYGKGWSLNLSKYYPDTQQLSLSSGLSERIIHGDNLQYYKKKDIKIKHINSDDMNVSYEITHSNGTQEILDIKGYIKEISNESGYKIKFHHLPGGELDKITGAELVH